MKRVVLMLSLVCLASTTTFAQSFDNPQALERLGLTEDQIGRIEEVAAREDRVVREAQVELNLYRAQLEKLLLDPDVNMREVERILKETTEWKLKSELANMRRRVEIRKIMGEEKWEEFLRLLRGARARQQTDRAPRATPETPPRR